MCILNPGAWPGSRPTVPCAGEAPRPRRVPGTERRGATRGGRAGRGRRPVREGAKRATGEERPRATPEGQEQGWESRNAGGGETEVGVRTAGPIFPPTGGEAEGSSKMGTQLVPGAQAETKRTTVRSRRKEQLTEIQGQNTVLLTECTNEKK